MYEVACWILQYNKISFEAINNFTVWSVYSVAATFLIQISDIFREYQQKNLTHLADFGRQGSGGVWVNSLKMEN